MKSRAKIKTKKIKIIFFYNKCTFFLRKKLIFIFRKCKPPPPEFRNFDKIPMDINPFSLDSPLLKESNKGKDSKYIEGWSYQDRTIELN